jgi:stage II sporulation protein D
LAVVAILATVLATPLPVHSDNSPNVRLLLAEKLPRVVVSGTSMMVEERDKEGWHPVVSRIRMAGFSPVPGGVQLDGAAITAQVFRVKSRKGMLSYAGRPYRGYLTVLASADRLMVVSHMPLESYLVGVVNGEVDSSWPMDAVKAQVVAARSYALYQMNAEALYYDLKTDVTDQVYAGVNSEDERAARAVKLTRGQVLYKDDALVQTFFHSSCGGNTTSAIEVWGVAQPAQDGVYCGDCEEAPYSRWNLSLQTREIVRAVKILYPHVELVRTMGIHRRSRDGRVQTLFVETGEGRVLIDAGEFRKVMGYRRLPSTRFSLGMSGDRIVLTGEGYGHGVGLCQWGARGSALRGMDYRQILGKYYVGAEIRSAY